jgi:hypothetical protein
MTARELNEKLIKNQVIEITYECRDIGYGVESGTIRGFWTGEVDYMGKYTIKPINGGLNHYFFEDEFVDIEDVDFSNRPRR